MRKHLDADRCRRGSVNMTGLQELLFGEVLAGDSDEEIDDDYERAMAIVTNEIAESRLDIDSASENDEDAIIMRGAQLNRARHGSTVTQPGQKK